MRPENPFGQGQSWDIEKDEEFRPNIGINSRIDEEGSETGGFDAEKAYRDNNDLLAV
ncbi:hypothetical protein KFV02_08200 [Desulfohalobiaceae bacterium Ax17]|uniref:hypothetical protein n=1 Tax=Desulfovulcanus ferrireducens TaxID=2831190 RepID=UPI00207B9A39|nr:hypothetical protein [Desulfovulcanus ferrireducens]MBT8763912.1 hypothetical protein [Desulfovulcanus ferrireducens]